MAVLARYRRVTHGKEYRDADHLNHDGIMAMKRRDEQLFKHYTPLMLMNIFRDTYDDYTDETRWEYADYLFKSCMVDLNITCPRLNNGLICSGSILWHSAQRLNMEQVKYCVKNGADPSWTSDSDGSTPLQQVVIHASEFLKVDTRKGADSFLVKRRGNAWQRYMSMVDLLLDLGANVNEQDGRGWTAVMHACSGRIPYKDTDSQYCRRHDSSKPRFVPEPVRRVDVIKDLFRRGARVDVLSCSGESAVSVAVQAGDVEVLRVLCAEQPDAVRRVVNVESLDGFCPIHHAATARSVFMMNILLGMGANGHAVDRAGRAPANIVMQNLDVKDCRFIRSEEQRLLTVLRYHGFGFQDQVGVFRHAVFTDYITILPAVMDVDFEIQVNSAAHQLIFLESAASRKSDVFDTLRVVSNWPQDVMCDAWLLYISTLPLAPTNSPADQATKKQMKAMWQCAMQCGLATHSFPFRTPPHGNAEEVKERLTLFGQECTELTAWEDLENIYCPPMEGQMPDYLQVGKTSFIRFRHRLAILYRIFGFYHTIVLQAYREYVTWVTDRLNRTSSGRSMYNSSYFSEMAETEYSRKEIEALDHECVRITCVEMEIGLSVQFTVSDEYYLFRGLDAIFRVFERCRDYWGRYDSVPFLSLINFPLLIRWAFHFLECFQADYFVDQLVLSKLKSILLMLASFSHVNQDHVHCAGALVAQFSPNLANRRRLQSDGRDVYPLGIRGYLHNVHSELLAVCREIATATRKSGRRDLPSVFHELLQITRDGRKPPVPLEDLIDRLPIIEALVQAGFDFHTRGPDGETLIARLFKIHAYLLEGELLPDEEDSFEIWQNIFEIIQSSGVGIHWDAPYSYHESLLSRAHRQLEGFTCVMQPGSVPAPTVPRLLCIAAKAISALPITVRSCLPVPMQKMVDSHRVPHTPAGHPSLGPCYKVRTGAYDSDNRDVEREYPQVGWQHSRAYGW